MARVNQFAKDHRYKYNQAKNLVKKGRSTKRRGFTVLEKTMNKAKDGSVKANLIEKVKETKKDGF